LGPAIRSYLDNSYRRQERFLPILKGLRKTLALYLLLVLPPDGHALLKFKRTLGRISCTF
jgi:hypothetical protein